MKKLTFFIFFLNFSFSLISQVQIKLQWLEDSIALGKPTPLSFSIRYPIGYSIIFPDSATDFVPFELLSKKYFPTQFEKDFAIDSVIYYVTSFEIDSIQKIQLPIGYVFKLDTTFLKSEIAHIPFQRKVYNFSHKTPYWFNSQLFQIPIQPNYTAWIGFIILLGVLIFLLFILFRKKILWWIVLLKIQKEWQNVQNQIEMIFQYSDIQKLIYELNLLWKNYLGIQDSVQPVSLTSKEFQLWIHSLNFIENKTLFIELCQLEERIFYASENIKPQMILEKKEFLKQELYKIYLEKRKQAQKHLG